MFQQLLSFPFPAFHSPVATSLAAGHNLTDFVENVVSVFIAFQNNAIIHLFLCVYRKYVSIELLYCRFFAVCDWLKL